MNHPMFNKPDYNTLVELNAEIIFGAALFSETTSLHSE